MTHANEEDEVKLGRRDYDELQIVDTTNILTVDELQELKRLAQLSRSTRVVVAILFAVVSTLGVPYIFDWFHKHWI